MSKKYPSSIRPLIAEAKERYKRTVEDIIKRENIINLMYALERRVQHAFAGCSVTTEALSYSPYLILHLTDGYNISKDVLTFLEENEQLLYQIGGNGPRTVLDPDADSYDIHWDRLHIYVYYLGGNCKRIQSGTETVEKPIYKLECF